MKKLILLMFIPCMAMAQTEGKDSTLVEFSETMQESIESKNIANTSIIIAAGALFSVRKDMEGNDFLSYKQTTVFAVFAATSLTILYVCEKISQKRKEKKAYRVLAQ